MYKPLLKQKLFFFFLDATLLLLTFIAAYYVRIGSFYSTDFPFEPYLENALWAIPLWIFLLAWGGRYELQEKTWHEILRIISFSSLVGAMLFVLIFFFRQYILFSRLIVIYIVLLGTALGMLSYFLETRLQNWKVQNQKDTVRVLIIGVNRAAQEIISQLLQKKSRHQPVAILAPFGGHTKEIQNVPVVGKLDALERAVEKYDIHEILLCDGLEQMLNLLSFAEGKFLEFRVSPEILGVFRENISPEIIAGKTLLSLESSPLFGWGQFWKRIFDVVFSSFSILILSPVFLIQKILNGPRHLCFKEERIGAGGRKFQLFRYARETSFFRDLPNIFNIFRGEMSFVGPRPALLAEWEKLPAHFKRRMILRPGMLGPWQLKKLCGEKDDFEQMCKDDVSYIQNWSFLVDMKIIILSKWEIFKNIFKQS